MTKTTIELTEEARDALREERLSHETNDTQVILRLCGEGEPFLTESEVRDLVDRRIDEYARQ